MLISESPLTQKIHDDQRQDPELIQIFSQLINTNATIPFQIQDEMLYFQRYDWRILLVIPQATVPEILETYHAHEMSAHMSRDRLYYLLKKQYYWRGMFKDISLWIAACPRCSVVKTNVPKGA